MRRRRRLKSLQNSIAGVAAVSALRAIKWFDRRRSANAFGALMRRVGPLTREHRIGRDNLRAAFPDKSDAEIERILGGVWDNLGRVAVEFAHLDEFSVDGFGPQTDDKITYNPALIERYLRMTKAGKPMITFAAHLANWELPAVAAKRLGDHAAILYRRPNIAAVSDLIVELRTPLMGELVASGLSAPVKLAHALEAGTHVGMLVDQHFSKGVAVTFFGRRCFANPLIAMLARRTECPIHGMRVVRRPDGNSFQLDFTDPIPPVRDTDGKIDVAGTMQTITGVVEGWVREHPEQWLWLHRRWR
jgi:KDO2-lipid IV(A) lauroyltransferase